MRVARAARTSYQPANLSQNAKMPGAATEICLASYPVSHARKSRPAHVHCDTAILIGCLQCSMQSILVVVTLGPHQRAPSRFSFPVGVSFPAASPQFESSLDLAYHFAEVGVVASRLRMLKRPIRSQLRRNTYVESSATEKLGYSELHRKQEGEVRSFSELLER